MVLGQCYEAFLKLGASISRTGCRFFIEHNELSVGTRQEEAADLEDMGVPLNQ